MSRPKTRWMDPAPSEERLAATKLAVAEFMASGAMVTTAEHRVLLKMDFGAVRPTAAMIRKAWSEMRKAARNG